MWGIVRILLVEDEPAARAAMARLLRRAGANVVTAGDGSEGLNHLLGGHFDVLLTDLHMPGGIDGFELIEATHRLPLSNRPRRVVAISGQYDRAVISDLVSHSAATDFFPKPIDLNSLLDSIGGPVN